MKIILETLVGSTAHGTAVQDGLEDLDLMVVCLESFQDMVGFNPKDTWVERTKPVGVRSEAGDVDRTVYGLRKFLSLALKGNPTILLPLFVSMHDVHVITPEGIELRKLASRIVSKKCFDPFRGYMRQQHERLLGLRGQKNVTRPELVKAYGYDTKYAGHIIRLGYQGVELLATGKITLPMSGIERSVVLAVRTGHYTLAEVSAMINQAETQILDAFNTSPLPEKPDYDFVENWMLHTYRKYWQEELA